MCVRVRASFMCVNGDYSGHGWARKIFDEDGGGVEKFNRQSCYIAKLFLPMNILASGDCFSLLKNAWN